MAQDQDSHRRPVSQGGRGTSTDSKHSESEPSGAGRHGKRDSAVGAQASLEGANRQRGAGREGGDAHRAPDEKLGPDGTRDSVGQSD
jgi:hypothetical protein